MNDATLSWSKSATGTPTSYQVTWTYNGTAQSPYKVPASAAQDASGYSQDFATANPTLTARAGDVIGATVQALDETNGLSSGVVTASSVTIPTTPVAPGDPQNVQLVLS